VEQEVQETADSLEKKVDQKECEFKPEVVEK
jgi:hypothetical protein